MPTRAEATSTTSAAVIHDLRERGGRVGHIDGPVFSDTPQGGFLRQSNFLRNSFAPALARAGLAGEGIRLYDMRHSSATLLLLAGVNVKVVSQRLGHESIEITLKHYAHCLPAMQQAAAEAWDKLLADCPTIVPREGREEGGETPQSKEG